ncbi:PDZ domain-containing protein [Clostridiaceae bacterium]|nr:PDZ domain-containing protein [Clostridiaceae bacterium]RKI16925.1 PDZ domain-containing protein [bacterium 1XD21-70]
MYILAGILLFGVIVLVHEFGHFLFAKLNGIGVVEFSIGMGPRLCSFVRGETRYSVKCLPFGGSCMMVGEDADNPDPGAFNNKPVWARISVIAAGPVFNLVFALFCAMVIVAQIGHDMPVLHDIVEGSPAARAGLLPGDELTRINNRKISSRRDVSLYLMAHPGEPLTVHYKRFSGAQDAGGQILENQQQEKPSEHVAELVPEYNEEYQSYMMGVSFMGNYKKAENPLEFLDYSLYEVKYCIVTTIDGLGMLFRGQMKVEDSVTGPVGIVSMVGETIEEGQKSGAAVLINIIATWGLLLSATLGIMNLLPIPALDGGRLLFLLIELLRGRPVDPEKEGMVHAAGMALLMMLMVLVLFNDIRKLM